MRHIRQKLHSRGGASMLLALLFFFFCLTVGAVVLTAASANAGRLARQREEQQRYLAVESAALLLREDLQTLKFTGRYHYNDETHYETYTVSDGQGGTTTVTYTWHEYYYSGFASSDVTLGDTTLKVEPLKTLLEPLYQSTCPDPVRSGVSAPEAIELPLELAAEGGLPPVRGKLTVDTAESRYALTVDLWLEEDGRRVYPVRLYCRPTDLGVAVSTAAHGDVLTTTYTQTIQWQTAEISKGGGAP